MDVSSQLHAQAVLTPQKDHWYPLNRSLGGPRASLNVLERRKISCPCCKPTAISHSSHPILTPSKIIELHVLVSILIVDGKTEDS
jgi:hypothetical protein